MNSASHPIVIEGVETLADDWMVLRRYRVRAGRGQTHAVREVLHRPSTVAVLLYTARAKLFFVEQVRVAVHVASGAAQLLEVASGLVDPGEAPVAAAKREALEETGLSIRRLDAVGDYFVSPAVSTEKTHLFLGLVDPQSDGRSPIDDSDVPGGIRLIEMTLAEALASCSRGDICDLRTVFLVQALARAWQGDVEAYDPHHPVTRTRQ